MATTLPFRPKLTLLTFERRMDRLAVPPCESCGSTTTAVVTRRDYVVYVRCKACGYVWSIPKPGLEPVGS